MITPEQLARISLFANVPASERATLATRAADLRLRRGEWLLLEGQAPAFFGLLDGRVDIFKFMGGRNQRLTSYGPGDSFGEVPLLLGSPAIASVQAAEPTHVLRFEADDFRQLVTSCPVLSSQLTRTLVERVGRIGQATAELPPATVTVIGPAHDPACYDFRDFLSRNRLPVRWEEPNDGDVGVRVRLADGRMLRAPGFRELARALELPTEPTREEYDVVIVGGGPAGLAAAVYGASEGLSTLLVERTAFGGQAGTSSRIENYLGFPAGLGGDELSGRAWQQAIRLGAELLVTRRAKLLVPGDESHTIELEDGTRLGARVVVLAMGVDWRRLAVPGIDRLVGHGVYYGAARSEAIRLRGGTVHLVGGGNSAGQAAMFFADFAESVTMLVRGPSLADSMSHYLIDQLAGRSNVTVETEVEVTGVEGDHTLEAIEVRRRADGRTERRASDGLFLLIGGEAVTSWLPERIIRDQWGYVCTGRDVMDLLRERPPATWPLARDPFLLETSVPGILAAGDVRHGSVKRVSAGVGEGSMAIAVAHQYLAERAATAAAG